MTYPKKSALSVVTRRQALGVCGALSVAGLASYGNFGRLPGLSSEPGSDSYGAEPHTDAHLYVFRPAGTERVVLAVTGPSSWGSRLPSGSRRETRFHLGAHTLTVPTARGTTSAGTQTPYGMRTFNGSIVMHIGSVPRVLRASLLELPFNALSLDNIWAEHIQSGGGRHRVASPFLAALLAQSAPLARAYDAGSPETDLAALGQPVASTIARMAERSRYPGDARAYGQRLARTLLPDVVSYDPRRPQGFTFAARNGRHPDDADFAVAHSLLTGTPVSGSLRRTASLQPSFPYFQRASV
jgi:hypothetical protein